MSGDTHAHALPNRNDDLDRLVHVGPCRPNFQNERDKAKFVDGSRRFFDGRARWLHVGCCALTVLARPSNWSRPLAEDRHFSRHRRRSTPRPKAQLPPHQTALVEPVQSQNGGHFLSWRSRPGH